jgi:hypothetical protein
MKLLIIIVSLVGIVGGILTADIVIRFMFQHRITDAGIDIMLFGKIPLQHIAFSNITEIRRVSFKETLRSQNVFSALRFGIYGQSGGIVLLQLREGIRLSFPPDIFKRKTLFVFPYDPDRFVQGVLQRLPK